MPPYGPKCPWLSGRSCIFILDSRYEGRDFRGVLDAFDRLYAAGHIDRPRPDLTHRRTHVARRKPAREYDGPGQIPRYQLPVERLTRAAVKLVMVGVQQ